MLDKGTGNKTWKERGVGEFKLLKHRESSRIRCLMRQEKTMKVIVNHFCDPRINLVPNVGNDKSWVWVAFDFSDGELIETVSECVIFKPCHFSHSLILLSRPLRFDLPPLKSLKNLRNNSSKHRKT